ncbi:MAG: hypothetical protein EZS28_042152, partial [Streblomastix strix]
MITAPQDKEEMIGELIYKEKTDGMGGKTRRFIQAWRQIGKEEFINTGFYLRFKDQDSQQRLEKNKMIIPFRGTQEEKKAYQEMLKEELEEGKVIPIQQSQVKWWNHTFLIKKPNGTWGKILDASKLNKEIEKLHFKMHGLEEVQYLANQIDYATSLDLKSAFHHITPNLLCGSNRINSQTNKNTLGNQNTELLRRHTPDPSGQTNTQNINNRNNENIRTIQMDNFNRQMRNRTEKDNNIPGMDMEFQRNEYKNVGREKVEDDISIKGLVQLNIQEQEREDKITSSADRQIELSESSDKGSISISNRIRQSENASFENGIMGRNDGCEQSSNKGIEMVDKENRGQPTRITNPQDNNMHVNDRRISIGLGSDADIR